MLRNLAIRVTLLLPLWFSAQEINAEENNNQHNLLLSSASRAAILQLRQPCRIWTQQSLRTTTADIAQRFGVSVWIDRRLNPTQIVQLPQRSEDSTVGRELARLAEAIGAGSGLVENVFLIAPSEEIAKIQKAAVVLHGQLSSTESQLAQLHKSLGWSDVTSYQELLEQIQRIWEIEVDGLLPHDLLHGGSFPECSLATQLSILVGGFDLQAVLAKQNKESRSPSKAWSSNDGPEPSRENSSGSARLNGPGDAKRGSKPLLLTLRELSDSVAWQDSYARRLDSSMIADFRGRYPNCVLQQKTLDWIIVNGETNLHNEIVSLGIAGGRKRPATKQDREQLYSFNIESELPVEAVLENLSRSFALELEWSSQCSPADRHRLIQFKVENATRQKLLELVCEKANLRFEQSENRLIVHPRVATP